MSAPFQDLREAIDRHIEAVVDSCPYPASLYDPIRYVMRVGGKRVRPLLVLLSARSLGAAEGSILDLAAAVELLHTFTLVHDDIMDRDDMRRGHPTIHARWDEGTAILAGDALIGLAYRCLSRQDGQRMGEMIRTFTDAVVEVCEGQALDKEFEGRLDVTLGDYEDMIARKTGRLISMSARIGALAGDGDEGQVAALEHFGACLGKAFQIQDDLLDYFSSTEELGKAVGSDLAMRKVTYSTLKGRELLTGPAARRLEEVLQGGAAGVGEIRPLLLAGGVPEAGRRDVEQLAAQARAALAEVLPPEHRIELERYAQWILHRTH
ncbi:MAG: polyprenyl synthetase family protein [bacterium]|nr:polyprenyl synthetase family protein [bacterium]